VSSDWPAAVVAVAFVALVAFMFDEAVSHDFATVWAGAGTIVGVLVGAIPSFFFKRQSDKAQQNANNALLAADPDKFRELAQNSGLVK
jgi:ABC-type branched-subunit amino acid transport system permease subunit